MGLASASFTRPADTTAYAAGDLVANSTTAGSVIALDFGKCQQLTGRRFLTKCRLQKSGTGVTGAAFKVHIFKAAAAPTVQNGDNGAFLPSNVAGWVGSFDVGSMQAFNDGAVGNGAPSVANTLTIDPGDKMNVYALVEARGAYTPASAEVLTVTLEDLDG